MQQDKVWDYFQNSKEVAGMAAFNADTRYRHLARQTVSGSDVLNIGVGRGGLESLLLARGVNTYSLDPSSESIASLRSKLGLGDRAQVGYSQDMPFAANSFDTIVMSEVLEHLSDDVIASTFKEVKRVLRAGGTFIGTVPADENLLESRVVCPDCGKAFHRWGHVQSFSEARLKSILATEFSNASVRRMYLADAAGLNWKGKFAWTLKHLAVLAGVSGTGENLVFRAQTS
jgi:cyclopropane fatty-acyl-phospholipid synthase-like methyltransferase